MTIVGSVLVLASLPLLQAEGTTISRAQVTEGQAALTFVHLSPDSPKVGIFLQGKEQIRSLEYGRQAVASLEAGTPKIEVRAEGKTLLAKELRLSEGRTYICAIMGRSSELRAELLESRATTDRAHLRFFHASTDAGALDVAVDGNVPAASRRLGMGKSFETELEPGKHALAVQLGAETILARDLQLQAGACYTVFVARMRNGTPKLDLIVVEHVKVHAAD